MMDDPPTVTILLLGDSGCGKSTFLSKLSAGAAFIRSHTPHLPPLRDEDQPFVFNISMYNRPYRLAFHDTSSPDNYTLLHPGYILLCYDISARDSLANVQRVWWPKMIESYMQAHDGIPIMILGLKRDLRTEGEGIDTIYPQEGHRVSAELRCDQYAECSAVTGELMGEVFEDVARRAAKTTTSNGGMGEASSRGRILNRE